MARDYTRLTERAIAGTAIGSSPEAIQALIDIQQAAYDDGPKDTAAAQESANQAGVAAGQAQTAADGAQASADGAQSSANNAQQRADEAYDLAEAKVTKDVGPTFFAPTAAVSRAPLPVYAGGTAADTYTQADMQALVDQVAALTSRLSAVITDLRGNHALKP